MPEEFENAGFTLKTHQMFSVHTTPRNLKTKQSAVVLDLCLRKTRSDKSRDYRDVMVFKTFWRSHENRTSAFSNSSGLKCVFKKLHFHDGLVWTVGLTGGIKPCFQIPPTKYGRCVSELNIIQFWTAVDTSWNDKKKTNNSNQFTWWELWLVKTRLSTYIQSNDKVQHLHQTEKLILHCNTNTIVIRNHFCTITYCRFQWVSCFSKTFFLGVPTKLQISTLYLIHFSAFDYKPLVLLIFTIWWLFITKNRAIKTTYRNWRVRGASRVIALHM